MKSAILFLVFNRPEQTKRTFKLISGIRPRRLYIAADGPRKDRDGENELCKQVRAIVANVDWECTVNTRYQDDNLGCGEAVNGAISWFFDNEEEGIIIEDDCLVDSTFFIFCDELLERYRNDLRVMSISALNYPQSGAPISNKKCITDYSYSFSRYSLMWGWATWRRAWELHDRNMPLWPNLRNSNWLLDIGNRKTPFEKEWRRIFDDCYADKIDTWDYHWFFTCWLHGGLSAVPEVNMVRNLGFGADAAHTIDVDDNRSNLSASSIKFPLKHPLYLNRNHCMDRLIDREMYSISYARFISGYLLQIPLVPFIADTTRPFRMTIRKILSKIYVKLITKLQ